MKLDSRKTKKELAATCLAAVQQYLSRMPHAQATAMIVPKTNVIQVHVKTGGGPQFFEIHVKESFS